MMGMDPEILDCSLTRSVPAIRKRGSRTRLAPWNEAHRLDEIRDERDIKGDPNMPVPVRVGATGVLFWEIHGFDLLGSMRIDPTPWSLAGVTRLDDFAPRVRRGL
jgi:hypothetical protein